MGGSASLKKPVKFFGEEDDGEDGDDEDLEAGGAAAADGSAHSRWRRSSGHNHDSNGSNNSSSSSSSDKQDEDDDAPEMDGSLWGRLPDHLLEKVLLRLPLAALLRARCVCKNWSALLRTPAFLTAYSSSAAAQAAPPKPWFFMFTNHDYKDGSTFDPVCRRWRHIPLPPFPATDRFIPVAAAAGLVCFCASTDGHKSFAVCNLVTGAWRRLPPMLRNPTYLETVGMVAADGVVNQAGDAITAVGGAATTAFGGYKVVVAGNHEVALDDISTEVYESATGTWRRTGSMPRGADPLLGTVACGGVLYSWCCDPDGLVAYDCRSDTWRLLSTPTPDSLVSNTVLECGGRIMMVGGLQQPVGGGGGGSGATTRICVWELKMPQQQWAEVDSMPDDLAADFLRDRTYFMCVGTNDVVLLYIGGGLRDVPMLLYDLCCRRWSRVPPCTLPDHRLADGLIDGISFEPRLDAAV